MKVFVGLRDAVIHEMHKGIPQSRFITTVFRHAEPSVALIIEIDSEGVPLGHQHPLTQIEFSFRDDEGIFHVLLNHPLSLGVFEREGVLGRKGVLGRVVNEEGL